MDKVFIFFAEGFEEVEALTVVDLLRRASIDIDMISVTGKLGVTGSHGIEVQTDCLFEEADFEDAAAILLPGGMPGTVGLEAHSGLERLLEERNNKGGRIGAICAAPGILGARGFLKGKKAVCFPKFEPRLEGADVRKDAVITDGNITTGRGLGTAIPFALELITLLKDKHMAAQIKESIIYEAE